MYKTGLTRSTIGKEVSTYGLVDFLMMLSFVIVSCKGCGLRMLSVQIDGFLSGFCINEALVKNTTRWISLLTSSPAVGCFCITPCIIL